MCVDVCFLGFNSEDGDNMFLQNVGTYYKSTMALQTRKPTPP
jgi:hypothetical protein